MGNLNQDEGAAGVAAGTVIDARYKIVRCIGQGGNGMVHEVEHVRTGRHLALKSLLDETGFGRLEQEARATSLMTNSHAAKIIDLGTAPPVGPFLVMELLEGQSLRSLLDEAGQLPLELTVNIALQVCECLAEAHKHNIVHRDLKPENVFLCPSAWPDQHDVKVLDFGVVKIASDGPIPNNSLTRTGSTVGTPYYMSLEQLRNSSAVDSRADIYALGVVLYESLSGRKPFQADTIGDLVYALCSGPPTHLGRLRPDLPTELSDMVMRALSVNKDERPKSMSEFAAALMPHGNSAFGLWVKVDGKQPALAGARALGSSAPAPPALTPSAPSKSPPGASSTAPVIPRPTLHRDGAPGAPKPPSPPAFKPPVPPAPPIAAAAVPAPAAPVVAPPPQWHDSPSDAAETAKPGVPKRRDTPTEMYMKESEGPLALMGDTVNTSGDRDTPTRAIRTDLFEEQQRRLARPTLKSPFGADEPTGQLPTEDEVPLPIPIGAPLGGDMGFMQTLPASAMPRGAQPMDPSQPLAPNLSTMPMPQMNMVSPADLPFRPGWQRSMDNALAWVGRTVEGLIARFKNSPPVTRILIIMCLTSVGLLFLAGLLFLFTK